MKKLTAKIYFDIFMGLLWVFMLFFDEDFFHDILGLFLGFLVLIHLGYNLRKMKTEITAIFSQKNTSILWRYLANILLFCSASCTIVTGIFISGVVLPSLYAYNGYLLEDVHEFAAYLTVAAIGLHALLHWKMIKAVLVAKMKPFS